MRRDRHVRHDRTSAGVGKLGQDTETRCKSRLRVLVGSRVPLRVSHMRLVVERVGRLHE